MRTFPLAAIGLVVAGAAVPSLAPLAVSVLILFGVVFVLSRRVLGRRGDRR